MGQWGWTGMAGGPVAWVPQPLLVVLGFQPADKHQYLRHPNRPRRFLQLPGRFAYHKAEGPIGRAGQNRLEAKRHNAVRLNLEAPREIQQLGCKSVAEKEGQR